MRKPSGQRPRGVTLSDVALAAGVARSTASRVLSGTASRIAADTRARVVQCAQTLGYSPNPMARGLRTARSYTIGIGIPQLENPVFSEMIRGAVRAARELGYWVLITYYNESGSESSEASGYEHLARVNQVDGLIVATMEDDTPLAQTLERISLPFVVLNRKLKSVANHVACDSYAAARIATEHLLSLGHVRIAHLGGRAAGFNSSRRLAGYREALERHGIAFDPELVIHAGYSAEGGSSAMRELLERNTGATGLVAATTVVAAGALSVLHAAGVRVPEAFSIVGIQDVALASMLFPTLTAVRMPLEEMGERGVRGLVGLINGDCDQVAAILPPVGLIVRESSAPPAAPPGRH